MTVVAHEPTLAGNQRQIDLLNATVFGVQGQGGLLREMESLHQEIAHQTKMILYGAITMATSLVGVAAAIIATHH